MQYAMCLKSKIIHDIEANNLLIEVLNTEPLKQFGYRVVAIDDNDNQHEVEYSNGEIVIH